MKKTLILLLLFIYSLGFSQKKYFEDAQNYGSKENNTYFVRLPKNKFLDKEKLIAYAEKNNYYLSDIQVKHTNRFGDKAESVKSFRFLSQKDISEYLAKELPMLHQSIDLKPLNDKNGLYQYMPIGFQTKSDIYSNTYPCKTRDENGRIISGRCTQKPVNGFVQGIGMFFQFSTTNGKEEFIIYSYGYFYEGYKYGSFVEYVKAKRNKNDLYAKTWSEYEKGELDGKSFVSFTPSFDGIKYMEKYFVNGKIQPEGNLFDSNKNTIGYIQRIENNRAIFKLHNRSFNQDNWSNFLGTAVVIGGTIYLGKKALENDNIKNFLIEALRKAQQFAYESKRNSVPRESSTSKTPNKEVNRISEESISQPSCSIPNYDVTKSEKTYKVVYGGLYRLSIRFDDGTEGYIYKSIDPSRNLFLFEKEFLFIESYTKEYKAIIDLYRHKNNCH